MNLSSNVKAEERNDSLENSSLISHLIPKENVPANPEPIKISTEKIMIDHEEAQPAPAVKILLPDDDKQFPINSEINPVDMSPSIQCSTNIEPFQNMEDLRKRYLREMHNCDSTKGDTNAFKAFVVNCKERFYEVLTKITFNGYNSYTNQRPIHFDDFKNTFVNLRKIEELRRRENEDKTNEKNKLKENSVIGYRNFGIASLVLGEIRTNCMERTKIKPCIINTKNMKKFREILPRN